MTYLDMSHHRERERESDSIDDDEYMIRQILQNSNSISWNSYSQVAIQMKMSN